MTIFYTKQPPEMSEILDIYPVVAWVVALLIPSEEHFFNFSMTLQMYLYLRPFEKINIFSPFTVLGISRLSTPRFL